MYKRGIMVVAAMMIMTVLGAQEPAASPRVHRVWLWQESKDCLWNIAQEYYGDPWKWKEIYQANRDQIQDPRVIYPKQQLIIPPLAETKE